VLQVADSFVLMFPTADIARNICDKEELVIKHSPTRDPERGLGLLCSHRAMVIDR
jgi:hypothetical protein